MPPYRSNGKHIGFLHSDGVYRKSVKKSVHLFQQLGAWGIDYEAVKKLEKANCHLVEITDTEGMSNGVLYRCPLKKFIDGERRFYDGDQLFVPRSEFTQIII